MKNLKKLHLKDAAKLTGPQMRNVRGGSGYGGGSGGMGFYHCRCGESESKFTVLAINEYDAYSSARSSCSDPYASVSCEASNILA